MIGRNKRVDRGSLFSWAPGLTATRTSHRRYPIEQLAQHCDFLEVCYLFLFGELGLRDGDRVKLNQGGGTAVLAAVRNDMLPANCIRVPAAHPLTAEFGGMSGTLSTERIAAAEKVAGSKDGVSDRLVRTDVVAAGGDFFHDAR